MLMIFELQPGKFNVTVTSLTLNSLMDTKRKLLCQMMSIKGRLSLEWK